MTGWRNGGKTAKLRCWSSEMSKQPKSNQSSSRYDNRRPLQSMATPRRPEPPKKMGFLGFLLILGILAGLIWLVMLIFGLGPYKSAEITPSPTQAVSLVDDKTATPTMTLTLTLAPSDAPTQTFTLEPTQTPTITPSPTQELMPFVLKGSQETMSSALIRPELDGDWLILAGQVWDLQDEPVTGLTLHLYGELAGYAIDELILSGSATAYGESGYEFALENMVVDSEDSLYIQLTDPNGLALSHSYTVQTLCGRSKEPDPGEFQAGALNSHPI